MTVLTTPQVDLDAWMLGEVEKACEMKQPPTYGECAAAASWLVHVRASCSPSRITRFLCERCMNNVQQDWVRCACGAFDGPHIRVTYTERIGRQR